VGSRSKIEKEIERAYIAGFLDGDGSLMLQIKKRHDSKSKFRFMVTICFYQDTRHAKDLNWIKKVLGIGYISKRNDGMSELRINGYDSVKNILEF
jgi:intein/homing endonuclease